MHQRQKEYVIEILSREFRDINRKPGEFFFREEQAAILEAVDLINDADPDD